MSADGGRPQNAKMIRKMSCRISEMQNSIVYCSQDCKCIYQNQTLDLLSRASNQGLFRSQDKFGTNFGSQVQLNL